ncbi:hypothetical protein OCU04_008061 [Sclerotinia nivalis]|uniref:Uncharacterized protein n=1 Tax=Sclerotinia nivalis TaxID=352851 RepID=A0A9X0AKW1_9HELO|nr:hypothetical protein OCU04_008061 [Sclerotinia nivalis]
MDLESKGAVETEVAVLCNLGAVGKGLIEAFRGCKEASWVRAENGAGVGRLPGFEACAEILIGFTVMLFSSLAGSSLTVVKSMMPSVSRTFFYGGEEERLSSCCPSSVRVLFLWGLPIARLSASGEGLYVGSLA